MPRLTDATKQARRDHIANAAMECFARQGFAATSMQDIIEASGVSAGAFYSHFSSKTELVKTVAMTVLDTKYTQLGITPTRTDTALALSPGEIVLAVLSDTVMINNAPILLQVWSEAASDPELSELVKEFFAKAQVAVKQVLLRWLRETHDGTQQQTDHMLECAFDITIAALHGLMVRIAVVPDEDKQALIGRVAGSLTNIRFD